MWEKQYEYIRVCAVVGKIEVYIFCNICLFIYMIFVTMLNTITLRPNCKCRQLIWSADKLEKNEDESKYWRDTLKNVRQLTAGLNA
jgi:hypothetical protein